MMYEESSSARNATFRALRAGRLLFGRGSHRFASDLFVLFPAAPLDDVPQW
jgi:hypothetical protein